MPPTLASIAFIIGIYGLFQFTRDENPKTSRGLWIPVMWLWIAGSRAVTSWLQVGPSMDDPNQYLDGSPIDRLVFMVILAAGLVILARRKSELVKALQGNLPIILFFTYCLMSIIWSDYPFVAFKRWTKGIGDFVMVLIVITDPDQSAAIKTVLKRTAFILIPWSVLLVKYYPEWARSYNVWNWEVSYTGVTNNKNTLGMICLVFGTGCLWQFLTAFRDKATPNRVKQLLAYGSVLGMVLWLLHMANSMTSLSCFLLAGSVVFVASSRAFARMPILVHVFIAIVIVGPVVALFGDPGGTLLSGIGRDSTLTGRTAIWHVVLGLQGNPLVGCGYESFWMGSRLEAVWARVIDTSIQEAHNGYLEIYLNLGWTGVTLLAGLLLTGYRNAAILFHKDQNAAALKFGYFTVAVIYGLTEAGFRMLAPVWIFLLFACVNSQFASVEEPVTLPVLKREKKIDGRPERVGKLVGAQSSRGNY
jgi:exopolysaccharide production protein ExoQ